MSVMTETVNYIEIFSCAQSLKGSSEVPKQKYNKKKKLEIKLLLLKSHYSEWVVLSFIPSFFLPSLVWT